MSIRLRLILSYIAMLVVPVLLTVVAASAIGVYYIGDIMDVYHLDFRHGSVERMIKEQTAALETIQVTIDNDPDRLMDLKYLEGLDKKLALINSGIVLKKNNNNIYVSNIADTPEILRQLPSYAAHKEHDFVPVGNNLISLRQFDFYFKDNSPGTLFIISDVSPFGKIGRQFLGSLFLAILLILIVTNGLLTFIVSRSILQPIDKLKKAAGEIKEGNLNFKVESQSNDEIGELCRSFEEMRSKLKESIELQMQYEENRKELISNISHDLKTPITAIKGYTEGIMDGVADSPEKMDKYIQTIHSKVIDVDQMIDELFLFSKLDLNREPFNFEKVEIIGYLRHITEELQLDLDKKGVQVRFAAGPDHPVIVIADREKLKRVISNIIDNSIKYMDKKPAEINIACEDKENTIAIGISDNGQGISPESVNLIFDRFYRADSSRNTSIQGSGLGLAIARRIVEEHGGQICAQSEEGIGTSIFFTLKKGSLEDR